MAHSFPIEQNKKVSKPLEIKNLVIGKLKEPFTENLDSSVMEAYNNFCKKLEVAGAKIEDVIIDEAREKARLFPTIVGSEIISAFGKEKFLQVVDQMDPVTGIRAKLGLNVSSVEYINAKKEFRN